MFALCRSAAFYCLEFRAPLFFNLRDKTCNISTISKMNARRIKVKKRGGNKRTGKKKEADGYCKLNWLREGSDFHCDEPE